MTLEVNQTLDPRNFTQVPPGSVISDGSSDLHVTGHGYVVSNGGSVYPLYSLIGRRIKSIGDLPPEQENLAAFKQRLYTVCYGSAVDNSVRQEPVLEALRSLGCEPPTNIGVGMWVHLGDRDLHARLERAGAVFGYGNPNHWKTYAEYVEGSRRLGAGVMCRTMRVLSIGNPGSATLTDEYCTPPTEEDAEAIARLRAQVWVVGSRAKQQERWCPAYETAVGVCGVSEVSATQFTAEGGSVGNMAADDTLVIESGDNGTGYPVGAVFEYSGNGFDRPDYSTANWNWTRRVDGWRHLTRNYIGPNGGHYDGRRRVLWDGASEMSIPVTISLMRHLPEGTSIRMDAGGVVTYVKQEDGMWTSADGRYGPHRDEAFGVADRPNEVIQWRITSLPDLW